MSYFPHYADYEEEIRKFAWTQFQKHGRWAAVKALVSENYVMGQQEAFDLVDGMIDDQYGDEPLF